jgi:hypothetical protein
MLYKRATISLSIEALFRELEGVCLPGLLREKKKENYRIF